MLATAFFTLPIQESQQIVLENVTCLRVVLDENNTQRVLINGVPVLNRVEEILTPDGTFCPTLPLEIRFESGLLPTNTPVQQLYLQYRKKSKEC
jgi:hypothetical protein